MRKTGYSRCAHGAFLPWEHADLFSIFQSFVLEAFIYSPQVCNVPTLSCNLVLSFFSPGSAFSIITPPPPYPWRSFFFERHFLDALNVLPVQLPEIICHPVVVFSPSPHSPRSQCAASTKPAFSISRAATPDVGGVDAGNLFSRFPERPAAALYVGCWNYSPLLLRSRSWNLTPPPSGATIMNGAFTSGV